MQCLLCLVPYRTSPSSCNRFLQGECLSYLLLHNKRPPDVVAWNNHLCDLTVLMSHKSGCGSAGTSQLLSSQGLTGKDRLPGSPVWLLAGFSSSWIVRLRPQLLPPSLPGVGHNMAACFISVRAEERAHGREEARARTSERHGRRSCNLITSLLFLRSRSLDPSRPPAANVWSGVWRKAGDEAGEVGRERGCCPS